MHFIICLSHVSIYGPLAVTICNHVSPTTRAAPEPHSMKVCVCACVRGNFLWHDTFIRTGNGNWQRETTAPNQHFTPIRAATPSPTASLCECHCDCVYHMAMPLILVRSTGPRSSCLRPSSCCLPPAAFKPCFSFEFIAIL